MRPLHLFTLTGKGTKHANTVTESDSEKSDYLDCYYESDLEEDEIDAYGTKSDPDYDDSATDEEFEIEELLEDSTEIISISSDSDNEIICEEDELSDSDATMIDSKPKNVPPSLHAAPKNSTEDGPSYSSPAFNTRSKTSITTRAKSKKPAN